MSTKQPARAEERTDGITRAAEDYPGAAINVADSQKSDPALVKERTKTLNNNPRNTDDEDM